MGFTGPAALHWKLLYIEAFNKMEQALRSNVDIRQLVTQITTDVLRTVLPDIRQAVEPPPEIEDGRVHNSRRLDFPVWERRSLTKLPLPCTTYGTT